MRGDISAGHLGQTVVYVIILVSSVAVLSEVYGDLLRAVPGRQVLRPRLRHDASGIALGYSVTPLSAWFLVVLGVLVAFHELGHFLAARWVGVKVLKFSLGFGPKLFGTLER